MYYIHLSSYDLKINQMSFVAEMGVEGYGHFDGVTRAKAFDSRSEAEEVIRTGCQYERPWAKSAQVIFIHPLNKIEEKIENRCFGSNQRIASSLSIGGCGCNSCRTFYCSTCNNSFQVDYDGTLPVHSRS